MSAQLCCRHPLSERIWARPQRSEGPSQGPCCPLQLISVLRLALPPLTITLLQIQRCLLSNVHLLGGKTGQSIRFGIREVLLLSSARSLPASELSDSHVL